MIRRRFLFFKTSLAPQIHELSKLGEKVTTGGRCVKKTSMQETPKTVDELLDSFNDTRV